MPYRSNGFAFDRDPSPRKGLIASIWIGFAACCTLILAGCGLLPLEASAGAGAPIVVRADSGVLAAAAEASILADRLLRRESDALLLDESRRGKLTIEITRVLERLRDAYPSMARISVRETHERGVLLLGLRSDLFEAVANLPDGESGAARTEHAEFDALNARLGLWAVRPFSSVGVVTMYFDERLNVDAAARAYLMLEGVEYAEPNARPGDGSDIEASKSYGNWHVIVRKAWGDCPSGCMHEEMFFFTVDEGEVERIEPSRAIDMVAFAEIVTHRGWH